MWAMENINHSFPHRIISRLRQKNQPISFSCELTTKCNIRCDFCTRTAYTEKGNKKEDFHVQDMADETIDRVLEELEKFYKSGIPILFSPMGLGEPLIFGKLFEVFERVKKISPTIVIGFVESPFLPAPHFPHHFLTLRLIYPHQSSFKKKGAGGASGSAGSIYEETRWS